MHWKQAALTAHRSELGFAWAVSRGLRRVLRERVRAGIPHSLGMGFLGLRNALKVWRAGPAHTRVVRGSRAELVGVSWTVVRMGHWASARSESGAAVLSPKVQPNPGLADYGVDAGPASLGHGQKNYWSIRDALHTEPARGRPPLECNLIGRCSLTVRSAVQNGGSGKR